MGGLGRGVLLTPMMTNIIRTTPINLAEGDDGEKLPKGLERW